MAPTPPPPSLDDFVQKEREKKRNETLAQAIFGHGRNNARPHPRTPQSPGGSLMNRVTKPTMRTSSASNINRRLIHGALFERTLSGPAQPQSAKAAGFSIRGRAGPYVVIGSNFAPGTTDEDIQTTMEPVGGPMVSCTMLTVRPTVIAEMVFKEKAGADAVVARFNNQIADGRLLHFYYKPGPPQAAPVASEGTASSTNLETTGRTVGRKVRSLSEPSADDAQKNGRYAEPAIQDGTMGFPNAQEEPMEVERNQQSDIPSSESRSQQSAPRGEYPRDDRAGRDNRDRHDQYSDRQGPRMDNRQVRDFPRSYQGRPYRREGGERSLYSDRYGRRDYHGGYR